MEKFTKKILIDVYGENYDIIKVVEDLLEPISKTENETYDKLLADLTERQKQLLNKYLHLYAERIYDMQDKRYNYGFKVGMYIGSHTEKH